ncbi:SH3 domain-containing protein [Clostridium beijerinckii]|uniref:SH3 domain-containing protein n=1 Tax=Clostridium beijerinckii TaxID=1520 RepID=UPI00232D9A86|nr:SH3 domain-containing protein [Clostridium beijerinckii]
MINLDVYIIDELKNYTFHFPVNPLEKLSIQKEKKYTTVDILDFGEVDIAEIGEKISEISFDTLLPKKYDSSYCRYKNIKSPNDTIKLLEYWKDIDQPVRLIITDFNYNDLVFISKISYEERTGEPGDKYISITFRKFREAKITIYQGSSTSNSSTQLQDNRADNGSGDYKDGDVVTVTASALNVRDGPSTDHNVLGVVYKGDTLTIFRQYGNWADTYWGDHGGYVCLDYVSK